MTDNNLFQEIQEDLDRQKMEAFWKRYGVVILAAALGIVIATGGYSVWNSMRMEKNQRATADYMAALKQTDPAKELEALQNFAGNNKGSTQATFAQLQAAALALKEDKREEALRIYDAVAHDGAADPAFRQLADLYSVRAQLDTGDPAELQKKLEPLMADKAPWRYTAREYAGYVALRAGDKQKARQIFAELAQADTAIPQTLSSRAADMLRYVSE